MPTTYKYFWDGRSLSVGGREFSPLPYYTASTIQSVLGVVGLVGHNNDRRRPTKSHALHVTLTLRCANLTPLPTRANGCNKSQPFVSALYKEKLGYLSSIKLELSTMKGAGL